MEMSMRTLDLFPPLPKMMQGSESIDLDSAARLRALRAELAKSRPKAIKVRAAKSSSARATVKAVKKSSAAAAIMRTKTKAR
jgi:hypothetical protein